MLNIVRSGMKLYSWWRWWESGIIVQMEIKDRFQEIFRMETVEIVSKLVHDGDKRYGETKPPPRVQGCMPRKMLSHLRKRCREQICRQSYVFTFLHVWFIGFWGGHIHSSCCVSTWDWFWYSENRPHLKVNFENHQPVVFHDSYYFLKKSVKAKNWKKRRDTHILKILLSLKTNNVQSLSTHLEWDQAITLCMNLLNSFSLQSL